eukprot:CAMPEP_0181113938 /NCGR_PEP_ID=MMETSP1071-20121207/20612_1 /TAXON_ID=35127 /ORGANISM="Thalassiosira sp., Strain NH16" /LENGTH=268 /DNA_ID=CAMNT_0023198005 /DNA_START=77 /DNA_END=884 /DNA_ORIENTATION=+
MKSGVASTRPKFHIVVIVVILVLVRYSFGVDAFVPSMIGLGLTSPPSNTLTLMHESNRNRKSPGTTITRRDIFQNVLSTTYAVAAAPSLASASNLPDSTGADLSRTGSIDTLMISDSDGGPSSMASPDMCSVLLQSLIKSIPREEKAFKRVFDSYSTPVNYKQKFLDQNAFLVYYTKGYDGPGRKSIEEDVNTVQTLQYGLRNDAWTAMDDLYVELEFGQGSKGDDGTLSNKGELSALMSKVLKTLDSYLSLAPVADVEDAIRQLGQM